MTLSFTTTSETFSLYEGGELVGVWDRTSKADSEFVNVVSDSEIKLGLINPFSNLIIRASDTITVNGTDKSDLSMRELYSFLKDNVFFTTAGGGITLEDVENEFFEVPDSVVAVYKRKTTLTNDQIKQLLAFEIEIVPAPGVGKALVFHNALVLLHSTVAYTNLTPDTFMYVKFNSGVRVSNKVNVQSFFSVTDNGTDGRTAIISAAINETESGLTQVMSYKDQLENQPLNIAVPENAGYFTGGDASNSLEVTVFYSIVDL